MTKILLVDDDPDLVDLLTYALGREGYEVLSAAGGQQALTRWRTERPDLVLLDVTLPDLDGFAVCARIRHDSQTPVILLTARGEEADVLRGLQLGADDYVIKPFSPRQLAARLQAILRRTQRDPVHRPTREIRVGDLLLDLDTRRVTKSGRVAALTRIEFKLLEILARNAGRVVPYPRLVEQVWGYSEERTSTLLKVHIAHLRSKLGVPARGPGSICAVVGIGYQLMQQAVLRAPGGRASQGR